MVVAELSKLSVVTGDLRHSVPAKFKVESFCAMLADGLKSIKKPAARNKKQFVNFTDMLVLIFTFPPMFEGNFREAGFLSLPPFNDRSPTNT
jgi:hypothetical protein